MINGLIDALKERAPVIAIAGDVETKLIDTSALEELNPYKFFDTAALYIGRVINREQARAVFATAILTAVTEKGPTVISCPVISQHRRLPSRLVHPSSSCPIFPSG